MPQNPPPSDWPRLSSSITYVDAAAAIDWLCDTMGFTVRLRVEDDEGRIVHSELEYGEALVMVSQEEPAADRAWKRALRSPRSVGGAVTQSLMLFVDDADAHCAHARSRGAEIVESPATHDYGDDYWSDRSYCLKDLDGHMWWLTQRLRSSSTPRKASPEPVIAPSSHG